MSFELDPAFAHLHDDPEAAFYGADFDAATFLDDFGVSDGAIRDQLARDLMMDSGSTGSAQLENNATSHGLGRGMSSSEEEWGMTSNVLQTLANATLHPPLMSQSSGQDEAAGFDFDWTMTMLDVQPLQQFEETPNGLNSGVPPSSSASYASSRGPLVGDADPSLFFTNFARPAQAATPEQLSPPSSSDKQDLWGLPTVKVLPPGNAGDTEALYNSRSSTAPKRTASALLSEESSAADYAGEPSSYGDYGEAAAEFESGDSKRSRNPGEARRRLQTKVASRVYRARKKTVEQELRSTLAELRAKKENLIVERAAAEDVLARLRAENIELRRRRATASVTVCEERHELLEQLASKIDDPQTTDDNINAILKEIHKACGNVQSLGRRHLYELLSPSVVSTLVANGIFDTAKQVCSVTGREGQVCPGALQSCNQSCASLSAVRDRIVVEIPGITDEQKRKLDVCVREHEVASAILRQEGIRLASHLQTLFGDGFDAYMGYKQSDERAVELEDDGEIQIPKPISAIDHLRRILDSEAAEWHKHFVKMVGPDTLTVRQQAHFLLKVEYVHASVRQLARFWSALQKAWRPILPEGQL